jgi:hypothetical protein
VLSKSQAEAQKKTSGKTALIIIIISTKCFNFVKNALSCQGFVEMIIHKSRFDFNFNSVLTFSSSGVFHSAKRQSIRFFFFFENQIRVCTQNLFTAAITINFIL